MNKMKVINCPQCGGTVECNPSDIQARCKFCDSLLYFRDNEVIALANTVQQLDNQIEADKAGTKDARERQKSRYAIITILSIMYFISGILIGRIANTQTEESVMTFLGVWFIAASWSTIWPILIASKHHGYDVYDNKVKNSFWFKFKYWFITVLVLKAFEYLAITLGVLISVFAFGSGS